MKTFVLCMLMLVSLPGLSLTVYNKREYYPQFVAMKENQCGTAFFQAADSTPVKDLRLAIGWVNYLLHQNYEYQADGISDEWCVPGGDLAEYWADDCDGFAFRAAVELARAGVPRGNIFLATVLTYRQQVLNLEHSPYRPQWQEANHMVAMVIDQHGEWWVLDSSEPRLLRMSEVFAAPGYVARGLIHFANYGAGKPNDTAAGFARFWVEGEQQ